MPRKANVITGLMSKVLASTRKPKAKGCELSVRTWVPPGTRVTIHKVIGLTDDGVLLELEVLGASIVKD